MPPGRDRQGADTCTHACVQLLRASARACISHAQKVVNFQNLSLDLHLVSDEHSGLVLEDYHLGPGKPERDTFIIILTLYKFPLFHGHKTSIMVQFSKLQKSRELLLPSREWDLICRVPHTFHRFFSINRSVPKVFLTG